MEFNQEKGIRIEGRVVNSTKLSELEIHTIICKDYLHAISGSIPANNLPTLQYLLRFLDQTESSEAIWVDLEKRCLLSFSPELPPRCLQTPGLQLLRPSERLRGGCGETLGHEGRFLPRRLNVSKTPPSLRMGGE